MCGAHPNVVNINDCFDNTLQRPGEPQPTRYLLLVMEYMSGGELFSRIKAKQHFHEHEAAMVVREIASAIRHLHRHDVAHRDLKPENLLYTNMSEGAAVKLSDFGFAKLDRGDLVTPVFTPYYVPPQILIAQGVQADKKSGHLPASTVFAYDKSCDMWSLGVILYILLCGYPPFASEIETTQLSDRMKQKITNGQFTFHEKYWHDISDDAKSVVTALLATNPSDRMTADQLLKHAWVTGAGVPTMSVPLPTVKHMQQQEQTSEQSAAIDAANAQYRQQIQQMRRGDVKAPPSDQAARDAHRRRREKLGAKGKKNPFFKKLQQKQGRKLPTAVATSTAAAAAPSAASADASAAAASAKGAADVAGADGAGAVHEEHADSSTAGRVVGAAAAAAAAEAAAAEKSGSSAAQTRGGIALNKLLSDCKSKKVSAEVLSAEAALTIAAMAADLACVKQAIADAGIDKSGRTVDIPLLVARLSEVALSLAADSSDIV